MPVVPPGHHVVTIKTAPTPFFSQAESGPMMLNFGTVEAIPEGLNVLGNFLHSATEPQSVVWLMAPKLLPVFNESPVLLAQIASLVAEAPHISHLAVFPGSSPLLEQVMASFVKAGVKSQRGAPDGSCYVEVHYPDGSIVVGIPGPDSPVEESEPRDLDTLIKDLADHKHENDHAELLAKLPHLRLFLSMQGPRCRSISMQGLECVLAFTTPDNPRLTHECGVIDGLEALKMVLKTPLDGLLIQSTGTGWVILDRKQIEQFLSAWQDSQPTQPQNKAPGRCELKARWRSCLSDVQSDLIKEALRFNTSGQHFLTADRNAP